ncbi:hypothetical protein [Marinicella rhabdoformis]|uniref:hypothetical protein n=1 Tax=Marinicella rhabdoformis TaxID=2580566 RepID=UPI0012AEC42B|nr:hypothetical protein [Marinicella rhabdoformis]
MKRLAITLIVLLAAFQSSAVNISSTGKGEFLLIPYYNLTNEYNATVNVFNHDDKGKAVKVHIREGISGLSVLSYNIYLAPKDSWTFALGPVLSTHVGHENQKSGTHVSFDRSCAPGLNKSGKEFSGVPFNVPEERIHDMYRTREGFIEIIEMATIDPESEIHDHLIADASGEPAACQSIEDLWQTNGLWAIDGEQATSHLLPPTGSLSANATLINVPEGIQFPVESVVFSNFFDDNVIYHTAPNSSEPTLNNGTKEASMVIDGEFLNLLFQNGEDAISALIMTGYYESQFNLESTTAAATEIGLSFPTRRFYILSNSFLRPPFHGSSDPFNNHGSPCSLTNGGTEVSGSSIDRNGDFIPPGAGYWIPYIPKFACGSTATLRLSQNGDSPPNLIFYSEHAETIGAYLPFNSTGSGYFIGRIENRPMWQVTNQATGQPVTLHGSPVIGTTFQKATNANAAPGLLAQYGYSAPVITYPPRITN